jgi:hypothetical protein
MGALTLIVGAVSLVPATLALVLRSRVPVALTGCLAHAAAVGLAVAACSSDSLSPYTTWLLQVSGCKAPLHHRIAGWLMNNIDSPAAAAAVVSQVHWPAVMHRSLHSQLVANMIAEALRWPHQPCVETAVLALPCGTAWQAMGAAPQEHRAAVRPSH